MTFCPPENTVRRMNQGMTLASRRTEVCHDDPSVIEFCPARRVVRWQAAPASAKRSRAPFRSLTGGGTIRSLRAAGGVGSEAPVAGPR